jgi:hypothetical protein
MVGEVNQEELFLRCYATYLAGEKVRVGCCKGRKGGRGEGGGLVSMVGWRGGGGGGGGGFPPR